MEKAITALLACPPVEDAAQLCQVSRTTLWRMMQDPDFKRRLQEARGRLSDQIVTSLQAASLDGINTLRSIMLSKSTTASVRVTAAGKLLDLSFRAKQQLDIEQRVLAIELAFRIRKAGKE